jgi:hypothetical protein
MIRRSAMTSGVVAAAPLITSVLAPASAAAATATCGTFPTTVLCCPCLTDSDLNKDECCEIPGVTNRCQCVKAESNESKFCKPSGSAAQGDAFCTLAANKPACQTCRNNQEAQCQALLLPGNNCTGS